MCFYNKAVMFYFFSDFEDVLKAIKWPFVTVTLSKTPTINQAEKRNEMASLFKKLLRLNLPYPLLCGVWIEWALKNLKVSFCIFLLCEYQNPSL